MYNAGLKVGTVQSNVRRYMFIPVRNTFLGVLQQAALPLAFVTQVNVAGVFTVRIRR